MPPIVHTGSGLENSWKIANEKGDSREIALKNFWIIIYTLHQAGKKPGRLGAGLPANLAPRGRILRSRGKILGSRGTILGSLGKFLNSRRHIKVRQSPLSQ